MHGKKEPQGVGGGVEGRKGNLSGENKRTLAELIQERNKGVAPVKAGLKGTICTKLFTSALFVITNIRNSQNTKVQAIQ